MESTQWNAPAVGTAGRGLFMNPLIRKISRVAPAQQGATASYQGIGRKTIFFLAMILVGVALYFILHPLLAGDGITESGIHISFAELGVLAASALLAAITPFISFVIRPLIPVAGTLYCAGTGYLVAFLASTFAVQYAAPVWIALVLTLLVVGSMALLYTSGLVRVGKKLRSVVTTLFVTTLLGGLAVGVATFFPPLQPIVAFLQQNAIVSLIGAVVFVVIAALFLLVDFDTLHSAVDNHLPKKYEWEAAFALAFTVIWLYFKLLDLVLKAKETQNASAH